MKSVIIILFTSMLFGCMNNVGQSNLKQDATLTSDDEAVFIIGSSPQNYKVSFFPGSIKNGIFHVDKFSTLAGIYQGYPENGYIVGKVKTGLDVAIINVNATGNAFGNYHPCDEIRTLSFNLPSKGVYYVTDIKMFFDGDTLKYSHTENIPAAVKHIEKNYPNLGNKVQQINFRFMPINSNCTVGRPVLIPQE